MSESVDEADEAMPAKPRRPSHSATLAAGDEGDDDEESLDEDCNGRHCHKDVLAGGLRERDCSVNPAIVKR